MYATNEVLTVLLLTSDSKTALQIDAFNFNSDKNQGKLIFEQY